ncbi:MAG: hypothetical protein J7463_16670 [Roseiflexus sp.]|nr:hypothetical protein [Roseiflexus sp.]MBO9365343.1 hypothetical protein [Roseiflexus sp.]MBO9381979.1 hypothetical protein [Roseiflexus sp.]MBO9389419.1 hypothetical protein [Roseiflexus sp.]
MRERSRRREPAALRASKTDRTGRRIPRGADPRQGDGALPERGVRLGSAPHGSGPGPRGVACNRRRGAPAPAGAPGIGPHRFADGGQRGQCAGSIQAYGRGPSARRRGAAPGGDAGHHTGVEPGAGVADAYQGPAGRILTISA